MFILFDNISVCIWFTNIMGTQHIPRYFKSEVHQKILIEATNLSETANWLMTYL